MRNIFAGGPNFGAEESIRELLEKFGAVVRANTVTDLNTGRPRGFRLTADSRSSRS